MENTHKSALFILRRIRHGLGETELPKLTGTIEVDEVYIGGKPRYGMKPGKTRRGTDKTPVVGIVQRNGDVRFQMIQRITAENIGKFVAENAIYRTASSLTNCQSTIASGVHSKAVTNE